MPDDLQHLADVLADADRAHTADVDVLDRLTDDQVDYLAHLDEVEDPDTDGIEPRCV